MVREKKEKLEFFGERFLKMSSRRARASEAKGEKFALNFSLSLSLSSAKPISSFHFLLFFSFSETFSGASLEAERSLLTRVSENATAAAAKPARYLAVLVVVFFFFCPGGIFNRLRPPNNTKTNHLSPFNKPLLPAREP